MTNRASTSDDELLVENAAWPARAEPGATSPARSGAPDPRPARNGRAATDTETGASLEKASRRPVVPSAAGTITDAPAPAVEAMRLLIATLQRSDPQSMIPTRLGFTSALAGEGVTFVCRTLAAVIAHDFRERVCVIDLNWGDGDVVDERRRKRRKRRKKSPLVGPEEAGPGLADALRREVTLREILRETDDPRLTMVSAGVATAAEGQVFARSDELSTIIKMLERHHDRLVFDMPPVLASSAALPLTRQADAVGLVVRHGVTTEAQVRAALDRLGQTPTAGVVLNRSSSKIPRPLLRRLSTW